MTEDCNIILASEAGVFLRTVKDITDVLGAAMSGDGFILTQDDLSSDFFDLRSGLAGETFQKFTNYQLRVALVLPDHNVYGQRFSELAYEHRTHNLIRFVYTEAEARAWLCP
jgi:Domain of unknown function (DUF4180)